MHSQSQLIRIGNDCDVALHGAATRLFDRHGLASTQATRRLIEQICLLKPDIIHLHNIHGYYLNYRELFGYLASITTPVVWTLHDCWAFTGHCAYFMQTNCQKWRTGCRQCELKHSYPASFIADNSQSNYQLKRQLFTALGSRLTLVTVSKNIEQLAHESFFGTSAVNIQQIYDGTNTDIFVNQRVKHLGGVILGVANTWEPRKGLDDFKKLRAILPSHYHIKLVGLSKQQIAQLPAGIEGIPHIDSQHELARLYGSATVFVNPTHAEALGMTNIEALACGTPVVTYNVGGAAETIDATSGIAVPTGDVAALAKAIEHVLLHPQIYTAQACRQRSGLYDMGAQYKKYLNLYTNLLP